jgi:NAD(P)-dependent dehydrogenase (short-subunit alcohol dehydrogenase family)
VENGCNVLIADLALRPEAQLLADKHKTGPARVVFQETNVIDWVQLERMFEVAEKEFGEIDIVCPGAGVYEPVRQDSSNRTTSLTTTAINIALEQLLAPTTLN